MPTRSFEEMTRVQFLACGQSVACRNGQPEKLMKLLSNSFEAEARKSQWLSQYFILQRKEYER